MKQRRINTTLTIAVLALTTLLILTVLPQAGTAAPTVASLSTNPKRINEWAAADSFIRSPFVDSTPDTTTRLSAAPRLERQPLESLTALNSTEATDSSAPSAASAVQSPSATTWATQYGLTFSVTIVSDTSTQYLSETGWRPAILAWTYPGWPTLQDAHWIWKSYLVTPDEARDGTDVVTFRRRFSLPWDARDVSGAIQITADNAYELSLNGIVIGQDGILDPSGTGDYSWRSIETYQLNAQPGENELVIRAINYRDELGRSDPYLNPAGVLFRAEITGSANSRGVSSLNPLFPLVSNQPLRAEVIVSNPGASSASYTITVSLWQGDVELDTRPGAVTVAPGDSEALVFNFGLRAAGGYQLRARILQDGAVVDNLSRDITILESDAQLQAKRAGQRLTSAAWGEFDEARDIVVTAYADSIPKLPGEAVGLLLHGLFEPLESLGSYAGISADRVAEASAKLTTKLLGVESLLQQTTRSSVEQDARSWVDDSLAPERTQVRSQAADFDAYVASHAISWDEGHMEGIVSARERTIRGRVEWEPIPWGIGPPPLFLTPTTLKVQALVYRFYEFVHKLLGILGILAGLAVIIIAVVGSAGISMPALITGLAAVGKSLWLWLTKPVTAVFLVVLALVLHFQSEVYVAPAITREHGNSLAELRTVSAGATGQAVPQVNTTVRVQGHVVDVAIDLRTDGLSPAKPFVETYLYTADGRVTGVFDAQPRLASSQEETIGRRTMLPSGQYRAVTVVHAGGQLAATSSQVAFTVDAPQVALDVRLADAQLDPGQALEATVTVTNTDPLTATGDLALFALTTTGDAIKAWTFNLAPDAAQQWSWRFVPQTGGPAILQASVLDASGELATQDVAYVVGAGASVALNLSISATNAPGTDVPLTLTAINAGTQPTTTLVSLVTTDHETGQTMHTGDITVTLDAGGQVVTDTVILAGAKPGSYAVRADLNGQPYRSVDFLVTAQDTLYASVAAHSPVVEVGQAITLTATVVNSVFTYTNASPVVTVQNPVGVTQTVPTTPIGVGQYQGQVTAAMTGTHEVFIDLDAPDYRVVSQGTAFAAGQSSWLQPLVDGSPTLDQTAVVTITVTNENNVLLSNTSVAISSTTGLLTSLTDAVGSASFPLTAQDTTPYTLMLARDGYGEAVFMLPVQVVSDTIPPALFLDAPPLTNQTPLTITGLTEAGASLTVNSQATTVDAQGRFATTVALSEGDNTLNAAVTDEADNTTTVTRTVTLDTVPPTLTVTWPPDGLFTSSEVVTVTGNTEVTASLTVSGTLSTIQPDGSFTAWTLLKPRENVIPVVSTDAAGNSTAITRTVSYSLPAWQPLGPPGGPVYDVALSPEFATDQTLFVATAAGAYRSTDGGQTWDNVTLGKGYIGREGGISAQRVIAAPGDSITRTVFVRGPTLVDPGSLEDLLRSTDNGETWNPVPVYNWRDLLLSPDFANDDMALVTFSCIGGQGGSYYVSTDGGATWQLGQSGYGSTTAAAFSSDFAHDRTLLAVQADGSTRTAHLARSTDAGQSWQSLRSWQGLPFQAAIAFSPDYLHDQTILADLDDGQGIVRSTDGGTTWNPVTNTPVRDGLAWRFAFSPFFPQDHIVYATSTPNGYLSTDAGASWTQLTPPSGTSQIYALEAARIILDEGALFAATDAGLFRGTLLGTDWVLLTGDILVQPRGTLVVTGDQGIYRELWLANGQLWHSLNSGYSWETVPTPEVVHLVAVSPSGIILVAGNSVWKSTDQGHTWVSVSGLPNDPDNQDDGLRLSPDFDEDGIALITRASKLYRTTDAGNLWQEVSLPPDTLFYGGGAIAFSPDFATDQTVFFAGAGAPVLKSTDGGATWQAVGITTEPFAVPFLALAPGYASNQTLFLASMPATGSETDVRYSTDGGTTWSPVFVTSGGHANRYVSRISFATDYPDSGTVYLSTNYYGVLASHDRGASWTPMNRGWIPGPYISSLQMGLPSPHKYLAADGGVWQFIAPTETPTIEVEIPLQVGWNHISLPLDPLTPYTAEGVCIEINDQGGDVAEIDRWYASGWDGHICGLPFNDFPIELGSDYFIRSNAASTWTIEGYEVTTTAVPLGLQVGWNSIGIPHTDAYTAESLCDEISDQCGDGIAVEVDRWHAGGWDSHICGLPFNNFAIEIGKGYFVKAGSAGTVTPTALPSQAQQVEPAPAARPQAVPATAVAIRDLQVSNLRDNAVTFSWITDQPAPGYVLFGETSALSGMAYDVRGPARAADTHYVVLTGLEPETTYYFDIVSGTGVDDNGGAHYAVTTGPTLESLPESDAVYGQVFWANGVTPAAGTIVYLTLMDDDGVDSAGEAMLMSALVDEDGWWQANLGNARLADGSGSFVYSTAGDTVTLVAQGMGVGLITQTVDSGELRPAAPLKPDRQFQFYLPLISR